MVVCGKTDKYHQAGNMCKHHGIEGFSKEFYNGAHGKARGTSMFFGGIRRSIPSYAQGFGGILFAFNPRHRPWSSA